MNTDDTYTEHKSKEHRLMIRCPFCIKQFIFESSLLYHIFHQHITEPLCPSVRVRCRKVNNALYSYIKMAILQMLSRIIL